MVDTKLSTGSIRKKHLVEAKQEKTKKIVEKVKQSQSDGPPAKKVKKQNPAENGGKVETEGERIKAKRIRRKKKAQKDKPVKNAERSEQKEAQLEKEAEEYLNKWKNDKANWKFSKNLQTWLICNMLKEDKVDSENFDILCEYLSLGQGGVRDNVTKIAINQSREIRAQVDAKPEEADENQEKLARCQRLIKLMTSKPKSADAVKTKKAKASPVKAKEEEPTAAGKKGSKKRRKGKADKLGLRKESKPLPASAPIKSEGEEAVEKKKTKGLKVVSFEEPEEAPKVVKANKAKLNGKETKKGKKAKGK